MNNENIYTIPEIFIDKFIPKKTWFIYIYNFLYYIGFGILLIYIKSYKEFINICFYAILLLLSLVSFFMIFPSKLHNNTRDINESNIFLKLTQHLDNTTNAFPSAHVAISVFIAIILNKYIGIIAYLFPILIFISCLFTKQHLFIDCIGGFIWGFIYTYLIYNKIYN